MSVKVAYIVPHPPLIFPEIGRGEEKKIQTTIDAMHKMADEIASIKPELIVVISPHSIMYADYIHISPGDSASGDMSKFNAPQVQLKVDYDIEVVNDLEITAEQNGISAGTLGEKDGSLDHATMIPLRFINEKYTDYKAIRIAPAGLPYDELYSFGKILNNVVKDSGKRTVIIASGDLSHKLKDDGPYGYAKEGPEFDKIITETIESTDFGKFMNIDPDFAEKAADCGLRAFIIMSGVFDKEDVDSQLYSYEGPFGVGYAVGKFTPHSSDNNNDGSDKTENKRDFLKTYLQNKKDEIHKKRSTEDEFVTLARKTVELLTKENKEFKPDYSLPQSMTNKQAGVFVSIKKDGELRGCIGTISPTQNDISHEIIRNAISASSEDPRFSPIDESELDRLTYSVDILNPPENISDKSMLDTQRYGVIVTLGAKRGLLLPNLDGIETVEKQIEIAMQKAGIPLSRVDEISLQRFEVVRHF